MMHRMNMDDPTMWNKIQNLYVMEDQVSSGSNQTRADVSADNGRRSSTYVQLNPNLSVHKLYTQSSSYIPDSLRIVFTRLRLSSHRLRVETGRWCRIPRQNRLCPCGTLQDEEHVLVCKNNTQVLQNFIYTEGHLGLCHLFAKVDAMKHLSMLNELVSNTEKC